MRKNTKTTRETFWLTLPFEFPESVKRFSNPQPRQVNMRGIWVQLFYLFHVHCKLLRNNYQPELIYSFTFFFQIMIVLWKCYDCNALFLIWCRGCIFCPSSSRIISLDSIMLYFRLNTIKSVDDLTQHFLMLSLCFHPKLLHSWYDRIRL